MDLEECAGRSGFRDVRKVITLRYGGSLKIIEGADEVWNLNGPG